MLASYLLTSLAQRSIHYHYFKKWKLNNLLVPESLTKHNLIIWYFNLTSNQLASDVSFDLTLLEEHLLVLIWSIWEFCNVNALTWLLRLSNNPIKNDCFPLFSLVMSSILFWVVVCPVWSDLSTSWTLFYLVHHFLLFPHLFLVLFKDITTSNMLF